MSGQEAARRPVCGHCGQPYGQRNTTIDSHFYDEGETQPTYKGPLKIIKEEIRPWGNHKHRIVWTLWNGDSWIGGYRPFCTLRCALDYARKAFAKGVRV